MASELFPPGRDVQRLLIIWIGWAGSEKVRIHHIIRILK